MRLLTPNTAADMMPHVTEKRCGTSHDAQQGAGRAIRASTPGNIKSYPGFTARMPAMQRPCCRLEAVQLVHSLPPLTGIMLSALRSFPCDMFKVRGAQVRARRR